jgi:hypothetical protein
MACQFKNLLGEPNKGIHSLRIGEGIIGDNGVAVFDVVLAIALGWGIQKIFNTSFLVGLLLSILLGIVLHRLFCVDTTVDQLLFT